MYGFKSHLCNTVIICKYTIICKRPSIVPLILNLTEIFSQYLGGIVMDCFFLQKNVKVEVHYLRILYKVYVIQKVNI